MEKLKNIIVGFAPLPKAERFIEQYKQKLTEITHKVHLLDKKEAQEMFTPQGEKNTISGTVIRFIQKHIGGGPAEFIRDLKLMNSEDRLIVIETENLNESQIEIVRTLAKSHELIQAKHFGDFSVEHFTFSENHQAEML